MKTRRSCDLALLEFTSHLHQRNGRNGEREMEEERGKKIK
jgi:hypothetical protein